jgi:drug/metabolite transporter (DMT)-like permease
MTGWRHRGVQAALGAALLFGISTPIAKLLLGGTTPWLLAGLLYLGSGIGLWTLRSLKRVPRAFLAHGEFLWLGAAILLGGAVAPVLLLWGLTRMPASGAALLLNAETVFTALIAWFAFRENFDRRIALGMLAIVGGALVLSWPGEARIDAALPALAVLGACLAWGLDNNLTRRVSLADASFVAMAKGLVAGGVNLTLALAAGAALPDPGVALAALGLGFVSYGASLTLFVLALRGLGSARAGAYFATAPFVGASVAIVFLGEPLSAAFMVGAALMTLGVWLHVTERHEHEHTHEAIEHSHEHVHDEHHRHAHAEPVGDEIRHTHWHRHEALTHSHAHYPDAHHRHKH